MLAVAVAQSDFTVGDLAGNLDRLRACRRVAAREGAALVVSPELALCGYPPEDLALRADFRAACREAALALAAETSDGGPGVLAGGIWEEGGAVWNAAILMDAGRITHIQPKRALPNYGVFDESRVFTAGSASRVAEFRGEKIGILVCEDIWTDGGAAELAAQGAKRLIVLNASPFERGKLARRREVCARAARNARLPLIYVNLVGAQDDILFDGGSFALDAAGALTALAPRFAEFAGFLPATASLPDEGEAEIWAALALGLGGYVRKNHFPGVLLGLSGGIDSALAAALAVDALSPERVTGVLLPSPHTSRASVEDALALAENLGIRTHTVPIAPGMEALAGALSPVIARPGWQDSLAVGGNIQSRLRGISLMALSNESGAMLINTGNKSEVAVGYTTLYGDSCGGYAPLKDVYKTEVYALARWRNAQSPRGVIPVSSLEKAPTAELAPGQKDEDQLPPYAVLDAVLARFIESGQSIEQIAADFPRETVERVVRMVRAAEFKRRQMPPGAKISPMLFGRDWRCPLTSGWKR